MYSDNETEARAAEICTHWDSRIRDSNWHPFKIIAVEGGKQFRVCIADIYLTRMKGISCSSH